MFDFRYCANCERNVLIIYAEGTTYCANCGNEIMLRVSARKTNERVQSLRDAEGGQSSA